MSDVCLVALVKKWSICLDENSSFCAVCEIANHLGLVIPEDYNGVRRVLAYVDTHYPNAYIEATKANREFWNIS
jgi:hypothetical protein